MLASIVQTLFPQNRTQFIEAIGAAGLESIPHVTEAELLQV